MEQRLLFINHREEEIKEFVEAMPRRYEIDTADNGIDAALLMKKNCYGVIIIDMELHGYDGEQLIKYINKAFPDTVCIVYTVSMTRGQLSFLLNEQNVFRIFLSPANFRAEFYQTIEEGFVVYGVSQEEKKEKQELEERYQEREKGIEEKQKMLERQRKQREQFLGFSKQLLKKTLEMFGGQEEQQAKLSNYERGFFDKAWEILQHTCHSFSEMEQLLQKEYGDENGKKEVYFYVPRAAEGQFPDTFYEAIYMVLWSLMKYFSAITQRYTISIRIEFENNRKAVIMLVVTLPAGTWEKYRQEPDYERYKKLTQYVAETLMDSYMRIINDDLISYRMELDLDKKRLS